MTRQKSTIATLGHARGGPTGARRLLHGLTGATADPSLATHLDRWGPSPRGGPGLVEMLDESGLAGHGGAWFPVATKWRSIAAARRHPVVVANGSESEPASHKDALLLAHVPHLVLDGLSLAAQTLGARRAIVYVPQPGVPAVEAALSERRSRLGDSVGIEVVQSPHTYLAGQETALVNAIRRHRAVPSFVGLQNIRERGVDGRPTLVQNAETLAHVALIGRYGAGWFRQVGTADTPGTMLLTVTGGTGPTVVETALGASLAGATAADAELATAQGVLLGGYGGGWVSMDTFRTLPASDKAARRAGATLGPGIVAFLGRDACPLAEMADVVRYMDSQGAGQCGPCVNGLAELAFAMDRLAYGGAGVPSTDRILEVCGLVEGRGACRHPDGVARFIRSGFDVFAREISEHQHRGPCARTCAPRLLPIPGDRVGRRVMSRA